MTRKSGFAVPSIAILYAAMLSGTPANAQSSQNPGFGVGNIHEGLVVGVIAGVAAVAAITVTYLVLHNRGVISGCVLQSGTQKTLSDSGGKIYSLAETGPPVPAGERVKLKGRKSGSAKAHAFEVVKVLKDYGHCQP